VKEEHYMFEKEIELAPPGSDRLASFKVAQGIVDAIDRLTAVMTGVDPEETVTEQIVPILSYPKKAKKAKEEPFPHIDTATDEGPTANTTDLTAAVDATVKDGKDE
jgi:hypothetical protein